MREMLERLLLYFARNLRPLPYQICNKEEGNHSVYLQLFNKDEIQQGAELLKYLRVPSNIQQ